MTNASKSNTEPARVDWRVVIIFWLAMCALYITRALLAGEATPLIADTDDAMRLSVVQDFLNGQGWFDHTQSRLNTPFGADIHWSRFIDLPLAGLNLLFAPFLGPDAYIGSAFVWPLLLLLALLSVSAALSVQLVGRDGLLPGLVLPVLSAVVLVEFAPGRVDHHNIQIILSLLMVYAAVRAWRAPRFAVLSGLAAATSLAIGLETLTVIIPAVLVFGLGYVMAPSNARQARLFGLSFGLGTLAHLLMALPPTLWLSPACDALSLVYGLAALGAGAVFVLLSVLPLRSWLSRLLAGALLGGVLVIALILAFPQCLAGPYAGMDPWLAENWLSRIIEAKPIWYSLEGLPAYTIGIIVPPVIGVLVMAYIVLKTRGMARAEWATLGLFLALGLLVTLLQVRGARLIAPMAVPAGAWLIVAARARYLDGKRPIHILGLLGAWLGFSGLAVALFAGWIMPRGNDEIDLTAGADGNRYDCLAPSAFVDLAGLAPERIMAPVDLGAHLLLFTRHAVVAAPYHRNQQGVRDAFDFFNQPLDEARAILDARGISLIVTCRWLNEMRGFDDTPDTAFVKRFERGDWPDWIEDVSLPGATLKVYAVVK